MSGPELPVLALVDLLEAGVPLDVLATVACDSPVGLVTRCVAHLAEHPAEFTNEQHSRACAVLATALGPDPDGGGQ